MDATQLLLQMARTVSDAVKADTIIMDWISGEFWFYHYRMGKKLQSLLSGFARKCIIALESIGDEASKTEQQATIDLLARIIHWAPVGVERHVQH